MAITKRPPNVIYLGGGDGPGGESGMTVVNDLVAVEAITPGMLVETHNDGGVPAWGVHDSADQANPQRAFALEQLEMNLGVDDPYADGDLCKVGIMQPGSLVWALVPSGQNLVPGDQLQSNGDGKLKELASGTAIAIAQESTGGAVTEDTRVRVEVV